MNQKNEMRQMTEKGRAIESESFSIIDREAGKHPYSSREWEVVRRVIHATADFEFKELIRFSNDAIDAAIRAFRSSSPILVDVGMVEAGLNRNRLDRYGCRVYNFISDEEVIREAKASNTTRAIEAVRKANRDGLLAGSIVAVGNAPTALLEVCRLARDGVRPALIVGVPVGFVSAAESKEEVQTLPVPYIVSKGRKGGSAIAVSIVHALLSLCAEEEK